LLFPAEEQKHVGVDHWLMKMGKTQDEIVKECNHRHGYDVPILLKDQSFSFFAAQRRKRWIGDE
jgi:hypothetical protein